MIPQTPRGPGPLDIHEVLAFQTRYGLQADGKVGQQTMGQVLEIEYAWERAENKPVPKCGTLGVLVALGAIALIVAIGWKTIKLFAGG